MGQERRRHTRRMLPFGRSAVLEIEGKNHIVSLIDISRSGAYLGTRIQANKTTPILLKLLLPQSGAEMRLRCQLVRRIEPDPAGGDQLAGLAVQFDGVPDSDRQQLENFVVAGGFRSVEEVAV